MIQNCEICDWRFECVASACEEGPCLDLQDGGGDCPFFERDAPWTWDWFPPDDWEEAYPWTWDWFPAVTAPPPK